MKRYALVCDRCGCEEVHDGPVWEDWFVPRICERVNDQGICGGTMLLSPIVRDDGASRD